jgi:hypothetical protein
MAGNRWGGFSGRERAPKSLTSSCVSSTARPDCSLQGATLTLGHVWTFKHSAAGVVTMICSPTVLACIDPMHFSALYKKEPGRVDTLWAGKPAPGNRPDF